MTEAVKIVTFINMIFVVFLILSGSVGGILGEIIYYCLAFALPVAIGIYASSKLKYKREQIAGVAEEPDRLLSLDAGTVRRLLPFIAPSVAIVFAISLVTSLLLSLVGVSAPAVENKDLLSMLVVHALTPAILEEAVFRYLPLKLLAPYSKRWCVFYSALCFALIHCNFSQIPYAFAAGVIFMLIDVAFDSVWPSVILHFVNNTASVVWMKYCDGTAASWIFVSVLIGFVLISMPFIFAKRRENLALLRGALDKGEKAEYTYAPLLLAAICGYIAVANLFV